MKTCTTKKLVEEKSPVYPDWKESKFANTVDGRMMIMIEKASSDKHFIEAHVLSWSVIEELLLPRLIGWIAKNLKINLPDGIFRQNAKVINFLYLTISHDKQLYDLLEQARIQRNIITHRVTEQKDIKSINLIAIRSTRSNVIIMQEIEKRFQGEVLIPSINLYRNGWNDGLGSVIKKLDQTISFIENSK